MEAENVSRIIFSSSATVYGTSKSPLSEDSLTGAGITNPYGQTKYVIENVNGVISFVGSNGNPDSLKPDEVKRFLGDHDGGDGPIKITEAAPFKVGDSVNVKDGPFIDFSGIVQEVNHEKQKLKVSVSIFGRSTPVELDYLQVALEN